LSKRRTRIVASVAAAIVVAAVLGLRVIRSAEINIQDRGDTWHLLPRWLAASTLALASIATAQDTKNVLVLYGNNVDNPYVKIFSESLRSTVSGATRHHVEFYSEYFDLERFSSERQAEAFVHLVQERYADRKIDVIVSAEGGAFELLVSHRKSLFPEASLVYGYTPADRVEAQPLPAGIYGVPVDLNPLPTIELALRLHPGTKRLVLVTGGGAWDVAWEERLRRDTAGLRDRLQLEFLARRPLAEVLARLSALPKDALVFTPGFLNDGAGAAFIPRDTVKTMAARCPVPLYVAYDTQVGDGATGGVVTTFDEAARQSGEIVAALLEGRRPEELKLPRAVPRVPVLDWRQIRRWGIDERLLPPNAVVRFREPSVWEKYWREISIGVAVVLLQAALIAALLFERRARRRTAGELVDSEHRIDEQADERFRLAVEAAPNAMVMVDQEGRILLLNAQAEKVFGYSRAELLGSSIEALIPVQLRTNHSSHRDDYIGAPSARAMGVGRDLHGRRRDGSEVAVEIGLTPIRIADGWFVLASIVDITERRRLELEAVERRNELAHLSRVAMLGELSGSLAHELNQPLAAILSNAQAALRFLENNTVDLDEVRSILADIAEDDKRAGEVIRRLRGLLKKEEIQQDSLDMNEVVTEVLKLVRSDLVNRNVMVDAVFAPDLPPVMGDRVQLQQVVLNLVVNACDAMQDNAMLDRRLIVRTDGVDGTRLEVTVADRGVGIAPDQLERVFEPFVTTKKTGMGLGLAVCRTIINAHGGRIWATNRADRGAIFHFEVPAGREVHGLNAAREQKVPGGN
jgi:PAS domain S-box-containing protein